MKYLNIITFCAALFLVACGGEESADNAEGKQLKRFKAELVEKKEVTFLNLIGLTVVFNFMKLITGFRITRNPIDSKIVEIKYLYGK